MQNRSRNFIATVYTAQTAILFVMMGFVTPLAYAMAGSGEAFNLGRFLVGLSLFVVICFPGLYTDSHYLLIG